MSALKKEVCEAIRSSGKLGPGSNASRGDCHDRAPFCESNEDKVQKHGIPHRNRTHRGRQKHRRKRARCGQVQPGYCKINQLKGQIAVHKNIGKYKP